MNVDQLDSPIGPIHLRFTAETLTAVTIVRDEPADQPLSPGTYPHRDAFARYFAGNLAALSELPIKMNGTEFQQQVWSALRRIPPGQTLSYRELAQNIGNAKATRAVGSANGRNPLCIVVPCHRVISADGTLGGFSAGLAAKRWLLRHEGAQFRA